MSALRRPLALHTEKPVADVDREVVPTALAQRPQHHELEADCRCCYLGLGDGSLL
jgi:hypothetical protein